LAAGVPARLTPAEGRKFGLTVGIAFLVLGGIVRWRGHGGLALGFFVLGATLVLAGLMLPGRLGPVYRTWMGFALLLSKVTTPIFMSIVYFLVIAPIGLLMRLIGRNPMVQAERDGSYFVQRPAGAGRRSDITRQF
jgi:hypothetical protein